MLRVLGVRCCVRCDSVLCHCDCVATSAIPDIAEDELRLLCVLSVRLGFGFNSSM